ncbi:hypothetical protein RE428_09560 [Marinobacter nanhaiticus D15-8W]|uniref:Uncharacterized protein n=1 Tax=Marinobacter nanhaiticus D15-8W TaxID=626887 RepID=N6VQW6_9GAMM|nr:hypothetical protein [Marinobacter nanhaiticus]ENO12600.1 hypothetical protein J057_14400 [Marinobacter nanhaiticus D15-8W]BES69938.1 hypothetical protein RE428_09560 [Marinobacter nanhaiticus D15-8W]
MLGKLLASISTIFLSFILAACGGDGDDSSSLSGLNPENVNAGENPEDEDTTETLPPILPGYYYSEVSVNNVLEYSGATIIDSEGNFATYIPETDGTFGTLQGSSDNQFIGSGVNFTYTTNWERNSGTITGSATNNTTATLFLDASQTDYQSVTTISRPAGYSDSGATLSDISGIYLMQEAGLLTKEFTIQDDGSIEGSDESGCRFDGTASVPDQSVSVIRVAFIASNCGDTALGTAGQRNGDYSGLGILMEGGRLLIFGHNDTVVTYFNGQK